MLDRVVPHLLNPTRALQRAWRAVGTGSFETRLKYDIFPRPHYAYCIYQAAKLASRLGVDRISVLEFGVAGGNGLVEMERIAKEVEPLFGVGIEIWGFDSGKGLPAPRDYRDLPYIWQEGFFEVDITALEARLERSRLILGDVRDTVPSFFSEHDAAPIGAAAFDLDYYSSTIDSLNVFAGDATTMLPRAFCYMDDIMSTDTGLLSERVGQRRAIHDYNSVDENRELSPIAGFRHTRAVPARWNEQIYVHHSYAHPDYCTYIHDQADRQLPLAG